MRPMTGQTHHKSVWISGFNIFIPGILFRGERPVTVRLKGCPNVHRIGVGVVHVSGERYVVQRTMTARENVAVLSMFERTCIVMARGAGGNRTTLKTDRLRWWIGYTQTGAKPDHFVRSAKSDCLSELTVVIGVIRVLVDTMRIMAGRTAQNISGNTGRVWRRSTFFNFM